MKDYFKPAGDLTDEYLETKRVLDEEYSTIDATFNSDFLGY